MAPSTQASKPLIVVLSCLLLIIVAALSYYSTPLKIIDSDRVDGSADDNLRLASGDRSSENIPPPTQGVGFEGKPQRNRDEPTPVVTEMEDVTERATVIVQKPEIAPQHPAKDEDQDNEIDMTQVDCRTSRRNEQIGVWGNHPRFQYIHVPKTGGTSIQLAMVTWVFRSNKKIVLLKENGPGIRGSSFRCPFGFQDASMLIGHRGYGFCEEVERAPKGLFTFATFRRGASRIISLWDYNMNRGEIRSLRVFGNTPLNVWVKRYNATPELEEGERLLRFSGSQQVRFMCGYECMGPNALNNKTVTLPFMMKRAIENLKKVDVVGITEELNECISQLKFHLPYLQKKFASWPEANEISIRKKSDLDAQSLAILQEWAKPDQELYEIAYKLYKKKDAIAKECLRH